MSSTVRVGGIIRQIDELGRIVIPIEMRKRLGISDRDPLEITMKGDTIVMQRPNDRCVFCSGTRDLVDFQSRQVCGNCRRELSV